MVATSLARYRLLNSLGRGSQGESFLAAPAGEPDRYVVVKVMHSHHLRNDRQRRQMEREVQSLSRLSHPYIVRLIESCLSDPDSPALVMEYVRGVTLADDLRDCPRLPLTDAAWIVGCVCHALDAAHAQGIVHRDLKPANIMRSDPGTPEESIRLMDFGCAASVDRPHISMDRLTGSENNRTVGTPAWIAPEQLRGDPIDHRSDFYSLGIVAFQMLTGRHPFPYADTERLLRAQLNDRPPTFAEVRSFDLPSRLEELIGRCLSKHPADRPGSGRELAIEFGLAIGYDVWEGSRPIQHAAETRSDTNLESEVPLLPSDTRSELNLAQSRSAVVPGDPLSSVYYLDAYLPEALAVMKLHGFLSEFEGRLLGSEPGLIRMRVGKLPAGGLLGRLLASGLEPVDIDLLMEKTKLDGHLLRLTVHFHPPTGYRVRRPGPWRTRCAYLYRDLSAYLMARN